MCRGVRHSCRRGRAQAEERGWRRAAASRTASLRWRHSRSRPHGVIPYTCPVTVRPSPPGSLEGCRTWRPTCVWQRKGGAGGFGGTPGERACPLAPVCAWGDTRPRPPRASPRQRTRRGAKVCKGYGHARLPPAQVRQLPRSSTHRGSRRRRAPELRRPACPWVETPSMPGCCYRPCSEERARSCVRRHSPRQRVRGWARGGDARRRWHPRALPGSKPANLDDAVCANL